MTAIGAELNRLRTARGLSLRALSRETGVSNPYLSQIERGEKHPSPRILTLLAAPLQVSAQHLMEIAGIFPAGTTSVEDAVAADPRLTPAQRAALSEVYQAFLAANNSQQKPKEQ